MSQPPGPPNPYDGAPPQPYGQPQQPGIPAQPAYGQPAAGYGTPQPQMYGYGYPQSGGLPPGMPPLAGWGARLGAMLLDGLMFNLVPVGLVLAGYIPYGNKVSDAVNDCHDHGIETSDCTLPDPTGTNILLIVIGGLLSLAVLFYLSYREGQTGQTPGKKILGIRVLREQDGAALGFGRAFGRRLLHGLDALPCFLGFLWPLWDQKNQTWADKMVTTVVIKDQF